MKNWSFNTCAISGFALSGLAVLILIVNALGKNLYVDFFLPVAIVSLVAGGALSVRAHYLWMQGNKKR